MPNRFHAAALAAAIALAASWPAEAKQPNLPSEALRMVPDEGETFSRTPQSRISNATGYPVALYRVNHPLRKDLQESMGRQYLREAATQLGLQRPDLSDLRFLGSRRGLATTALRFAQTYKGVPVYGAEIKVSMDSESVVIFVMNGYKRDVSLEDATPRVTKDVARATALAHLKAEGPMQYDRTDLVVYQGRSGSRLAWKVVVEPGSPLGTWETLVDAKTGAVFRVEDQSCYGSENGTGTVFNPDPLSSAQAAYGAPGFVDGSDADTPELNGQRVTVTLRDIDNTAGFTLRGPFAEIRDFELPNFGLFTQAGSDFSSTRSPNVFEAANTYYHIDTFMRYINDPPPAGLGVVVMPFQYVGGVRFDPSGFNGADNSHYLGGSGQLAFGEGGVDDAEDADVIIHELGHGIHHWITNSGPSQVEGLSEGTGDYLAQSYSRSFNQWPSSAPAFQWTFSWDGHNPFWSGRITNYAAHYPEGLVGQVHTDGQIWATANMRIWDQLGRTKTDKVFLEGLNLTTGSTNQDDAAQAMMNAAAALGYSLADQTVMLSEFTTTGYTVTIVPVELMSVTVE
ncbi:MAG TPA: peptidase [Vicinamibacteria bacterium]|nr:peptidase [Vicinamibacteria bacterium]